MNAYDMEDTFVSIVHELFHLILQTCEVGTVVSNLQMRKLRLREVK